jgi:hypothetical protein
MESNDMAWFCTNCGEALRGHPKILMAERIFCFACAKDMARGLLLQERRAVEEAWIRYDRAKDRHERELETYRRTLETRAKIVAERREEYAQRRKIRWLFAFFLVASFGSAFPKAWLGYLVPFALAVLVGFKMFNARRYKTALAEFDRDAARLLADLPEIHKPAEFSLEEPECADEFDVKPFHRPAPPDNTKFGPGPIREQVLRRDACTCRKCRQQFAPKCLEVHHVIPREWGGNDDPTNLLALCVECHRAETWYGHVHKCRPDAPKEPGSYGPIFGHENQSRAIETLIERTYKRLNERAEPATDENGKLVLDEYAIGLVYHLHISLDALQREQDSQRRILQLILGKLGIADADAQPKPASKLKPAAKRARREN